MRSNGKTRSSPNSFRKLSCANCRRSKLKCDRIRPCASCKLRGLEDQCYKDLEGASTTQSNSEMAQTLSPITPPSDALAEINATLRGQHKTISSLLSLVQSNFDDRVSKDYEGTWREEVVQSLPSQEDCQALFDICFANLDMIAILFERKNLTEIFERLKMYAVVERIEAATLLVVLASAALMTPPLHPLRSRISCSPELEQSVWLALADKTRPLQRLQKSTKDGGRTNDIVMEITLEMCFIMYFSHAGREDELWDVLGSAIRKGARISLFDERHALWKTLNEKEKIQRRRLGLCIALSDAWTSFNRMRAPGILHTSLHLDFTSKDCQAGVHPLVGELDPRQLSTVHRCHEYIIDFEEKPALTRYTEARILSDEIKSTTEAVLSNLGMTIPLELLSSYIPSAPENKQAELLVVVSTSSYSACMVTRRFLTDPNAPPDLRFVSLQHAQNILATVPICTSIVRERRIPVNPAWNSNQLLCAASAFAVMLMGRDHYLDAVALPSRHDTTSVDSTGKKGEINSGTDAHTSPSMVHLVEEQLEWLSTWIFDILDCLEVIQASTGNRAALLCLRMVQGMCRIDRHLQQASARRYKNTQPPWQAIEGASTQVTEMQNLINSIWSGSEEATIASEFFNF